MYEPYAHCKWKRMVDRPLLIRLKLLGSAGHLFFGVWLSYIQQQKTGTTSGLMPKRCFVKVESGAGKHP